MKPIIRICTILILSLLFSTSVFSQNSRNSTLEKIRKNLVGQHLKIKKGDRNINTEESLSLLQDDGSILNEKPVKEHVTELIMQWAIDYHKTIHHNKKELRIAICKALQHWLNHHPKYKFPQIPFATLKAVAAIELVIYDDLMIDRKSSPEKKEQVDKLIKSITEFSHWCWYNGKSPEVFDKAKGHNRGGNVGYRLWAMTAIASCSSDPKEMDWVQQKVKEQFPRVLNAPKIFPTGFTPDGSWIQHNAGGAQNYWIGYGPGWVQNVLTYAETTKNSNWALTDKEWNTLADYYLEGIQWYYYKDHGALNIAGRHNGLKQAPYYKGDLRKEVSRILNHVNKTRRNDLKKLITRYKDKNKAHIDSTKYFWNTDLLIHSKPNAYFAIKMLSNRSTGCETSTKKKTHGKNNFLSGDGSTIIYSSGKEYDKARIGWNWRAWPGITAIQKTGKLPLSPWGKESKSLNQFAGGLSTGYEGIAAFKYNRKNTYVNLKANKAYFSFDNKMFAMGNSINKNQADPFDVWTTINQTERKNDINFYIDGKKGNIKTGRNKNLEFKSINQVSWIHHDNTGYVIIPNKSNTHIKLFAEDRTGNWADLDGRYTNKNNLIESTSIFQLSLSHGSNPDNESYSYMVLPGINIETLQNCIQNKLPVIIQNDKMSQAIKYDTNSYMIIFYKAGEVQLDNTLKLETDQPLIIHLRKENSDWHITLSDPLHKQEKVKIKLTEKNKTKINTIDFPTGMNRGKSIESTLKL